jgi:acetyltransferase-like isoleucine patch superfamily enzyme
MPRTSAALGSVGRRARTLREAMRVLRMLATLDDDQRAGLVRLSTFAAEEGISQLRAPEIDPQAIVSPLASLRFTQRVSIGPRANIGPFCCIWGGWSRTWARVEAGALLSPGVVLVAGNHRVDEPGWIRNTGFEELDVTVGEGAWVGAHAAIVGCRVGAGAVIGAGAVVLEDVPDNAIAVGMPARVVGERPAA